jgi:hypothetical protein
MPKIDWSGCTEIVDGVIIGQIETREYYRFYSQKDGRLLWDARHFENDQEAIDAFWDKFSCDPYLVEKYKKEGVEMRVWS